MARVVIYTTNYCSYCRAAKALLSSKSIPFEEVDVSNHPDKRAEMEKLSGCWTVPQIYIDGVAIGGFDNLRHLELTGEFERLMQQTR